MSIQHRIFYRIMLFVHKIFNNSNGPKELHEMLVVESNMNTAYELRSNGSQLIRTTRAQSKFGELMFKNFGAKLINKFSISMFKLSFNLFSHELLSNFDYYLSNFFVLFNKFDVKMNYDFSYLNRWG
jgi:hypothetical protein